MALGLGDAAHGVEERDRFFLLLFFVVGASRGSEQRALADGASAPHTLKQTTHTGFEVFGREAARDAVMVAAQAPQGDGGEQRRQLVVRHLWRLSV